MKLIVGLGLSLGVAFSIHADQTIQTSHTVYQYKHNDGTTILTNKKKEKDDTDWTYQKQTQYVSSRIEKTITEEELEKEEIRVYKQQYQEWLKKGGKNSGIKPPIKPVKIVHELTFWPVLYGKLWVGTGLIATDSIKINEGYDTNEDCLDNRSYYIQTYGKQLNLDIPKYVKVAKQPKRTYSVACYSTIGPVEHSLVP